MSSKSFHRVLEDRDVLGGDGVRVLKISQGSFTESFIKIQHQEACQDFTYHQSLFSSSKSHPGVFEDRDVLDGAGDGVKVLNISKGSLTKSFIKIQHLEVCQESTYPPSHFLDSWRKGMFLMEQEMVSKNSRYPREVLLKVSSRSNSRKLVKTLLPSKSLSGVLEERDVLDGAGDGVKELNIP